MEPRLELRQALRALARRPSTTAIVVATLGLGIGTCTAIFSLGYGILARPFPYPEPERLVRVQTVETSGTANVQGASLLDLDDWTRHARSFESLALHVSYPAILNPGSGPSQSVRLTFVTAGLFRTLAVRPALGRDFTPAEDQEGGDVLKVILSDGLWRSRDHRVHTALARLRAGVAAPAAAAEMSSLARRLAAEFPRTNQDTDVRIVPLREAETGALRPYLGLLFGAVALVLLIVCANVANLLLAQGAARARELRLRTTLGASRFRLVRMLLLESLLLGLAGGLAGALVPVELPFWMRFAIDLPVLSFTLGLALATSLVFGVVPAWQMSGDGAAARLSDAARGVSSSRAARGLRSALVLGETALASLLLVAALPMMQSFVRLLSVDAGVRSEGLVAIYVSRFVTNVSRAQSVVPYTDTYERVLARLRELPGVTHVGAGYQIPFKEQPEARQKQSVAVLGQDERERRRNAPVVWSARSCRSRAAWCTRSCRTWRSPTSRRWIRSSPNRGGSGGCGARCSAPSARPPWRSRRSASPPGDELDACPRVSAGESPRCSQRLHARAAHALPGLRRASET